MKKFTSVQWIVLIISLFLMFGNSVIPVFGGFSELAKTILCIFVATIMMLLTIDTVWPTFLSLLAFVFCNVYTLNDAVIQFFGSTTFWFCAVCTLMSVPITESGLVKRLAIWFLKRPIAKKGPWYFIATLLTACLLIGSVMNCTVMIVVAISLVEEVLSAMNIKKGNKTAELLMLGVMIMTGVSYGATPIGHPVAVLAIEMFSNMYSVDFFQYSVIGLLAGILIMFVYLILLKYVFKLNISDLEGYDVDMLEDSGSMTKVEKVNAIVFAIVILLWILPSLVGGVLPEVAEWINKFGTLGPAIVGTVVLAIIHVDGKPVTSVSANLSKTAWSACIVLAASLGLSAALNHPDAGIVDHLSELLGTGLESLSPVAFMLIVCIFNCIFTNLASDTVACSVSASLSGALIASGVIKGVHPGVLAIAVGITACTAYATPPASTYSAIMAGTGWVRPGKQALTGVVMALLSVIIAILVSSTVGMVIL